MTILTILTNFRLIQLIREPHLVNFVSYAMSFFCMRFLRLLRLSLKKIRSICGIIIVG